MVGDKNISNSGHNKQLFSFTLTARMYSIKCNHARDRGRTPPQEAIDACRGLSENATCEFTTPQDTLSGTCTLIQSQLACVLQGEPPAGAPYEAPLESKYYSNQT